MKLSIHRIPARIKAILHPAGLDTDFEEELAHHLEQLTEEYIAKGLSPEEARREAQIQLGGAAQLHELHRETRGIPWIENFLRDFRYTLRGLKKERGFTLIVLLLIAIGIGLNTTVFSLVNTVLLRPLPFAASDRLVVISNDASGRATHNASGLCHQIDTWEGFQKGTQSLDEIEAYNPFSLGMTHRLSDGDRPETVVSLDVSAGLFNMLGLKPMLGRNFSNGDTLKNAPQRVILSYQFWRRHFNADPHVIGKTVRVNDQHIEIVGVLPQLDTFTSVFFPTVRIDAFAALKNDVQRGWGNTVSLVGRTKPGESIGQVGADLNRVVSQLEKQFPNRGNYYANVEFLDESVSANFRRPLTFLWAAAGFLLAIVSFNLGGLLLARGAARKREFSVRCALGADRPRIIQQLMTESFTLVVFGSVIGSFLAWALIHFLSQRTGIEIPLLQQVRLDLASLGFTVFLCLITVLLCGLLPAWNLTRQIDLQDALREGGRGSSGGLNQSRLRGFLVIMEVAFACILAISASLMIRSLFKLMHVDLGFQPSRIIAVRIDPPSFPGDAYVQTILDRVRMMPGIEQAGVTDCIPVERDRSWGIKLASSNLPEDKRWTDAHIRLVSPGLLGAMGTPVLAGRDFSLSDKKDAPPTTIINQTLANHFWPAGDALGKQLIVGSPLFTVVAVVEDTHHGGPEVTPGNEIYFCFNQVQDAGSWDLMIRTSLPVATLHADLQAALREIDPTLPLTQIRSMQSVVDVTLSSRRLLVILVGGFAAIALGLAMLGLYGLISYTVVQQTKENGIRVALGATSALVLRRILSQTLVLTGIGLLLGLFGASFSSRAMQSLLYGVAAGDELTYIWVAVLLLGLAALSGLLPALRASRTDPMIALRGE
jgi:predicted permease